MAAPIARLETVTRTIGGFPVDDAYSWLEDDTDEALDWQRGQDQLAQEYLSSLPQVGSLRSLAPRYRPDPDPMVRTSGGVWFRRSNDRENPALEIAEKAAGAPRLTVPLPGQIWALEPSPGGRQVACVVTVDRAALALVVLSSEGALVQRVDGLAQPDLAWLPDGTALFYIVSANPVRFGVYGDAPLPPDVETAAGTYRALLQMSSAGEFILTVADMQLRRTSWALREGTWQPHPNALVSGRAGQLLSVSAVDELLVCNELVEARSHLTIIDPAQAADHPVALPGIGAVTDVHAAGPSTFTFVFSTPSASPSLLRYDVSEGTLAELVPPVITIAGVTTEQRFATRPDGSRLSMFVSRRVGLDSRGPNPVLVYGFGALGLPMTPSYEAAFAAFIDQGGTQVVVNLRGGGEYGDGEWRAATRERKQATFDDLYLAVEELIRLGITTRDLVGYVGYSGGALPAGAAITQRPDLFKVVVALVPLTDMLGYTRDTNGRMVSFEFGDPDVPDDARFLHAYSPYHNVRNGTDYPAVFLGVGATDSNCPPWHARKFAARLQAATGSGEPILLRVWQGGHEVGPQAVSDGDDSTAEWLGFVMDRLGMKAQA